MARSLRPPGPLRMVYWLVMLAGIALLLWYLQRLLGPHSPTP
ncbi:MAG TPA: hypothetical protein VER17_08105 [Tepidisphaeraceae bacterium]|nr:hypothetical protein [Tepidisphaeraceae bacterium]